MTVGLCLIKSMVIGDVPYSELRASNIDEQKFVGTEVQVFEFVVNYLQTHGRYPRIETVELELDLPPGTMTSLIDEPFSFWATGVERRWKFGKLERLRQELIPILEAHDTEAAETKVSELMKELNEDKFRNSIKDIETLHHEVMDKHNAVQQMSAIPGVPFGLPYIDGVSGGIQGGDIVILVGQTGVGKTFLTLQLGRSAYEAGHNVLAVCTEMPELQVARRDLAIKVDINSNLLKMGKVSDLAKPGILHQIDAGNRVDGEEVDNFYKILPGGIYSTFEDISAAARELKPDLLIVDGAPLVRMTGPNTGRWTTMIDIIEAFKNFALKENIGVLLTYHFGKGGKGSVEGVYGGQAMSQFASMMLSFEFEKDEDRGNQSPIQYRLLKLIKGRDGESGQIQVLFNMKKSSIEQSAVIDASGEEIQYTSSEDNDDRHIQTDPSEEDPDMYGEI